MNNNHKEKPTKLPKFFKPLFWSYNFSTIDSQKNEEGIIINTINYGDWEHWQWIIKYYGRRRVKKVLKNTSASEFRKRAFKLISLLLEIKEIKYASRGLKIRAERNIS